MVPMLYATTATTRLDHIRANLDAIRARVGGRLVLVAVKADAYGHGAVPVSRMLEATGAADWLGVATVDEAVAIRDAGVRLPILKLSHALGDDEVAACGHGPASISAWRPAARSASMVRNELLR